MNEKHDPANVDCDCASCLEADRRAISLVGRAARSPVMAKLREHAKRRRKRPQA